MVERSVRKVTVPFEGFAEGTIELELIDNETVEDAFRRQLNFHGPRTFIRLYAESLDVQQRELTADDECPNCEGSGQESSGDGEREYLCALCGGSGNGREYVSRDGSFMPNVKVSSGPVDVHPPF